MNTISHGACGRSWKGSAAMHCSGCHETFSGLSLFDLHRTQNTYSGSCKDPKMMRIDRKKLRLVESVWHRPEDPMSSDARDRLKRSPGPEMPPSVLGRRKASG